MTPANHIFAQKLNLPGFELTTSAAYSSQVSGHRHALRALAVARISSLSEKALSPAEIATLGDLATRPRVDRWALSIAHCPRLGGLALAHGGFGLGLDVEESSRVTAAAAKRVASFAGEAAIVAHALPVSFWVAKESSIKAFGNFGKLDLNYGVVEITSLSTDGTFTSRWQSLEARGFLLEQEGVTLAVARTL